MPKNNLNRSEKSILSYLEQDARTSYSKIGKRIRKSQQQVSYTVHSLQSKEIIQNFYTIIDYSKLGMLLFRVYFRVSYTKEETFESVLKTLAKNPHISWLEVCGGNYDLIATFFAKNPSQFNKLLRRLMEKYRRQLQNYTVLTTVVKRHFGRSYLDQRIQLKELFIGGDRTPEDLDKEDMIILKNLSEDARKSSVEISNQLDVTPKTVINRIRKLEEKEVILGYRPLLDLRKLGYRSALLLIKYHNVTTDMENKLTYYLKSHPYVLSLVKTLGEWDIEIEVEAEDQKDIRKTEREIRENFPTLVQDIQTVPLYMTYTKSYFTEVQQ